MSRNQDPASSAVIPNAPDRRDRSRSPLDRAPPPQERAQLPEPPVPAVARQPPQPPGPIATSKIETGYLSTMALFLKPMFPITPLTFVTVHSNSFSRYFRAMYNALANAIALHDDQLPPNFITADEFVLASRYFLKARCDSVYNKRTGIRRNDRCFLPTGMLIPKCIADVISSIGLTMINNNTQEVCPQPEPIVAEANDNLNARYNFNLSQRYSQFARYAQSIIDINLAGIPVSPDGRSFWLLYAAADPELPDVDADVVNVGACFSEFTPADSLLAAMTQHRQNGLLPQQLQITWTIERIRGVAMLRNTYALNA